MSEPEFNETYVHINIECKALRCVLFAAINGGQICVLFGELARVGFKS